MNKDEDKLSIVIPTYNGRFLLTKNLPKILQFFPKAEIIIIDDCSTDGTEQFIKTEYPKVIFFKNNANLGFSSTVNIGILKASFPLVYLINNDCFPKSNFLNFIQPYFKNKNTFAVSCAENKNGKLRGRGIGGFKRGFLYHAPGKLDKNNTLWSFGASTFYNRKIFLNLGGFDENFNPFYWEDFDLSYRALKSGFKIYFEKNAMVEHEESSTIKKNYSQKQIEQISFRNQILTVWKNLTDIDLWLKHIFWLPYHLFWISIKTQGSFLFGFFGAVGKIISISKKRQLNQFTLTDKEVLTPFKKELSL